ncbi:MAG: YihY family inner membrane protein [Planctomycetes bacterium]|nr:YihY family inner membrane protein [Planctomycetota bacterium]
MDWLTRRTSAAFATLRLWWRTVNTDLWEVEVPPERKLLNLLLAVVRSVVLLFEGFIRAEVQTRAAALTYKTVFAIVPFVAVVFAVLKSFGSLDSTKNLLMDFLKDNLAKGTGQKVVDAMTESIENLHSGAVGAIGFAVLAWTVISLMRDIEESLDRVWFLEENRPFARRFTIYWTALTLGPILTAASVTLTAFFNDRSVVRRILENEWISGAVSVLLPLFVVWVLFACLYSFVPNTKVKWGPALLAAAISGTVWEFTKWAYLWYNTRFVTNYKIYGTLGAIPVLLLWIYVSWVIVLTGAQISFAVQNRRGFKRNERAPRVSARFLEAAAAKIACAVADDFLGGKGPTTPEALSARLDLPTRLVEEVLHRLLAAELLVRAGGSGEGFFPAREPGSIPLSDVLESVRSYGITFRLTEDLVTRQVDHDLALADDSWKGVTGGISLRDLVERARGVAPGAGASTGKAPGPGPAPAPGPAGVPPAFDKVTLA